MYTKKIIIRAVILVLAGVSIFLITRPQHTKKIIPNTISGEQTIPIKEITTTKPALVPEKSDRTPTQFACVGEYCDGSMAGGNFLEKNTVIKIPLISDGGNLGCGAKIFFAPHTIPKTTAVLDATYKLLFDIKAGPEIPTDGFRNTVAGYTKLFYDRVTLENGTAKVYLTGSMYGPGHCAEPEIQSQMIQAALQYSTVNNVEIYLNGKVYDWCAMDESDGEGSCPEIPQLWVGKK